MINIIGGKFKRKKIEVPLNDVRPTSAIKREAIFSILESYATKKSFELYSERCFIDLFAGSGSLGLEAISRGGSYCYFYEINNKVIEILKKNCEIICKENQFQINLQDSTLINNFKLHYPLSVIFIDPPYEYTSFNKILDIIKIKNILNKDTVIVIETDKKNILKFSSEFEIIKDKIYGKTKLFFLKKLS